MLYFFCKLDIQYVYLILIPICLPLMTIVVFDLQKSAIGSAVQLMGHYNQLKSIFD